MTRIERQDLRFALLMVIPAFRRGYRGHGLPLGLFGLAFPAQHEPHDPTVDLGRSSQTIRRFSTNQSFIDRSIRTLWFSGLVVAGGTLLGVFIALVLNESFKGRGPMRSMVLLPWAIAPVVVGKIFTLIYSGQYGTLNGLLYQFHLIDSYVPWLTNSNRAMILVAIASVWQSAPLSALLLLAALQSLPQNLFSAAKIDGASSFQRFRKITVPWIKPMLLFVVILNTINALMTFDLIYVLTQGGPGESTTVLSWFGYVTFFNFGRYGEGAAILYVLSLISLLLAAIYFGLLTRSNSRSQNIDTSAGTTQLPSSVDDIASIKYTVRFEMKESRISTHRMNQLRTGGLYLSVALIAIWTLFPFYVMVNASFQVTEGILGKPPDWFPRPFTLENYRTALFGEQVESSGASVQAKAIMISMKNSAIVSVSVTLVCLIIGAPAGYAYARYGQFKLLSASLWILILTRMIPSLTLAVPFFILFRRLNLLDTKRGLVIALSSLILPLSIWILRGFFQSLPPNLERAGLVDGCTRFQAFRKIVIPVALPGLVAAGIFCFLVAWNEFVFAILLTSTLNSQTLPTRVAQFVSDQRIYNPGLLFAAGTLAIIPPVLITLVLQRFLLRGLLAGAIKG